MAPGLLGSPRADRARLLATTSRDQGADAFAWQAQLAQTASLTAVAALGSKVTGITDNGTLDRSRP